MAPLSDYVTGTITLTNGSAAFTGTGTGWLAAAFREGDTVLGIEDNPGVTYVIESITDNDAGTLTQPWDGLTGTYEYRMRYLADGQRVTAQARQLIELLGNGNLAALAGLDGTPQTLPMFTGTGAMVEVPRTDLVSGVAYDVQVDTLADRDAYDGQPEGFAVLVADIGDGRAAVYSRIEGGGWSDPAFVTGPVGPMPEVTVGSTTTGAPGTDADVTPTPIPGGVQLDFTIPAGEGFSAEGDYDGGTAYVKGDVVQQMGSSWIALQATTGNAPPTLPTTSNAYWQLLARAGIDGAGTVTTIMGGDGIDIDSSDPTEPVVSLDIMGESVKTANYTLVAADYGGTFVADDTDPIEFALEAAATLGAKWWAVVKNIGAGDLTLAPDGSETIDGLDELVLEQGQSVTVTCNGTGFRSLFRGGGGSVDQLFTEDLTGQFDQSQRQKARINIGAAADADLAGVYMELAEINGTVLGFKNGWADSFEDLSGVDVAMSSGYVHGDGQIEPSIPAPINITVTADSMSAGFTLINRNTTLTPGAKLNQVAFNSTKAMTGELYVVRRVSAGLYDVVASQAVSHGGAGVQAFDFVVGLPPTGTFYVGVYIETGTISHRINGVPRASVGGPISGTGISLTEDSSAGTFGFDATFVVPDIVLVSEAFTTVAVPTAARSLVQMVENEAITINTDVTMEVSRDDGATWAAAVLEEYYRSGSIVLYEAANVDLNTQPSGTEIRYRIKTFGVDVAISGLTQRWN